MPVKVTPSGILVLGSLNVDLLATVERLPGPGETVRADKLERRFGGKGANQAVAAVRQGAGVSMLGCLGRDADGRSYRARLLHEGIGISGIGRAATARTGTALIAVDHGGENQIVVFPGANGELTAAFVRRRRREIAAAGALLIQLEGPLPAVLEAIRIAEEAGVPVYLNPSPWRGDFPWGRHPLETVIVNETEAAQLLGLPALSDTPPFTVARAQLDRLRIGCLVITRGAASTLACTLAETWEIPAYRVTPVDTVGAGDTFAGTYVARRLAGQPIPAALRSANIAAALSTLQSGAQEAMPTAMVTKAASFQTVIRNNHHPQPQSCTTTLISACP